VPSDVTGAELDREVRADLRSLSVETTAAVSRHLAMAARLLDDDPELAWLHAQAAQRRAGRIAVVRETAGLTAYRAGHYEEALRELRTARRLTGSDVHLPVIADCERGLGRPERALSLASSADAARLDPAGQAEMRMVAAGARIDQGNPQAAVLVLQQLAHRVPAGAPWRARVYSAYADALEAAGRGEEARAWLEKAAAADTTGETGAYERLVGPDGEFGDPVVVDLLDDAPPVGGEEPQPSA
jgi:tetratricopeptide (TPR) repeat protein